MMKKASVTSADLFLQQASTSPVEEIPSEVESLLRQDERQELLILNHLRKTLSDCLSTLGPPSHFRPPSSNVDSDEALSISSSDQFEFGYLWSQIQKVANGDKLHEEILERSQEIALKTQHWEGRIEGWKDGEDHLFYQTIHTVMQEGSFQPIAEGTSGSYLLFDKYQRPCFVIKPADESTFCLHNPKHFGNPLLSQDTRVRPDIPSYQSVERDALTSEVARLLSLEMMTPKTVIDIVFYEGFYDLKLDQENQQGSYGPANETSNKKKLCSIQSYAPHTTDLFDLLNRWSDRAIPNSVIASLIDQNDFEAIMLLMWISYENDGHSGNVLTYPKALNAKGQTIFGLTKIDNSLCFPEKNTGYVNTLATLPNSNRFLSSKMKQRIASLPIQQIIDLMHKFELDSSEIAFLERAELLHNLSQRDDLTIAQIDYRMWLLSSHQGKHLALSNLSQHELEIAAMRQLQEVG
ncbi:MAG: hypothetical protein ACM3JI_03955 [Anaerolineae bacterium]